MGNIFNIGYRDAVLISFLILLILTSIAFQLGLGEQIVKLPDLINKGMEQLGPWAPVVFVILYIPIVLFFLPAWPLSLAGGIFFGMPLAPFYLVAGTILGGLVTFLMVKYLDKGRLLKFIEKRYQKSYEYYRLIDNHEISFVIFLHFTLVIPFTGINYFLGISRVSLKNFLIGTLIGSIPGAIFYGYLGYAVYEMKAVHFIVAGFLLLSLLGLSLLVKKYFLKRRKEVQ
ncbi:MAG: TVP38/TMEM64 family protein [Patescibacteria group bacterium]